MSMIVLLVFTIRLPTSTDILRKGWSCLNVNDDDAAHRPEVKFSSRSPTLMRIAPGIGSAESHSPVTDFASSPPRWSCHEVFFSGTCLWKVLQSITTCLFFGGFDSHLEEDGDCSVIWMLSTPDNASPDINQMIMIIVWWWTWWTSWTIIRNLQCQIWHKWWSVIKTRSKVRNGFKI